MEKYIAILKTYKDMLQFLHWDYAKQYEMHLLFERLMGDVDDVLDRFVEVSMGAKGITDVSFAKFKEQKIEQTDLTELIKFAKESFGGLLMESTETVQNVIVDILEMFDRHLYLL